MSIEVMRQALEALDSDNPDIQLRSATALRAAIEQAEKPVAYLVEYLNGEKEVRFQPNGWGDKVTPLYTAPRQWVGLTDEEVNEFYWISASTLEAIEAKLKEKNI
jgi:hypothetical protein